MEKCFLASVVYNFGGIFRICGEYSEIERVVFACFLHDNKI